MGCSPSSGTSCGKDSPTSNQRGCLIVELVNPTNQQIIDLKYSGGNGKKEDYLMNIMNTLFFADERNAKIDVCFHSLYSKTDNRFHYYLFRLLNFEIEDLQHPYKGKMWVLYIHNKPTDWDTVVNANMKFDFTKGGKLVWRYEKLASPDPGLLRVEHQLTQHDNLAYLEQFNIPSQSSSIKNARVRVAESIPLHLVKEEPKVSNSSSLRNENSMKNQLGQERSTFYPDYTTAYSTSKRVIDPTNSEATHLEIQNSQLNQRKLLIASENSQNYGHKLSNYLTTEEDAKHFHAPLHTENACVDNFDYQTAAQHLFEDSTHPTKHLIPSLVVSKNVRRDEVEDLLTNQKEAQPSRQKGQQGEEEEKQDKPCNKPIGDQPKSMQCSHLIATKIRAESHNFADMRSISQNVNQN